jgi:hypothetical protein
MTFEIKVSNRPGSVPLKLKVSCHEDKEQTIRQFCSTYKISREREDIIRAEVLRYFERQAANGLAGGSSQRAL